jgi:carboxymethylenebutenolidase
MNGQVIEFDTEGSPATGYLAVPNTAAGSGAPAVVVLHAWWGLTEPFRQACDQLAEAGFVALAPDLYRGQTTAVVEEAKVLGTALDGQLERVRGDIQGAMRFLRLHDATNLAEDRGKFAFIGFSLGGAYALDMSVNLPEEIAAVVTFYATYPDLDYSSANAAYLCHFAENDPYESAESVVEMEKALQAGGKPFTFYTYPRTTHWFFEANRPDAFDAAAAALSWERTISFIQTQLDRGQGA